jgi:hypothetical protein
MRVNRIMAAAAVLSAVVLVLPSVSSAQSVADLQAQIQALLSQVQQLQTQLTQLQGNQGQAWCHTFNTNLGIGSSGDEVVALQGVLQKEFPSQPIYLPVSNQFDENLASFVSAFQEKYRSEVLTPAGLASPTGYIGARTRAKLNALYGCGVTVTPPTTPPVVPPRQASSIAVVSPNGGEVLQQGRKNVVSWNSSNIPSRATFQISLISENYPNEIQGTLANGTDCYGVSDQTDIRVNSYIWSARYYCQNGFSNEVKPGKYRVRVAAASDDKQIAYDTSDAPFSIVAADTTQPTPTLLLLINGAQAMDYNIGGSWSLSLSGAAASQPVYVCGWQSSTGPNPVNINSITTCTPAGNLGFSANTSGYGTWSASGSFSASNVGYWGEWVFVGGTIVSNGYGGQTVSGGTQSTSVVFDVGVSTGQSQPAVTVTPPIAGAFPLHSGDVAGISWTTSYTGSTSFYYEGIGGQPTTFIRSVTGTAGSFNWTVPSGIYPGTGAAGGDWRIRGGNNYDGNFYSAPFSIVAAGTTPLSTGSLSVSPTSLTFSAQSGGQSQSQQLTLTNCPSPGCTIAKYYVNNPLPSSIEWLTIGTPTDSAPRIMTVTANPSNLPPGTYDGQIVVRYPANYQTVVVPVTVTVIAAPQTALSVSPTSITFSAQQGGTVSPSVQSLMLTNYSLTNGTIGTTYTSSFSGPAYPGWLVLNPPNGLSPNWATAVVNNANLGPGTYTANLVFTSNSQTVTVPVTLIVTAAGTTQTTVSLSPSTLNFSFQAGSFPMTTWPSQWVGFQVAPSGQLISWTAQTSTGWISVPPSGSGYGTGGGFFVGPTSQVASFAPGTYSGTITISPAAGYNFTPQTINVNLTVTATPTSAPTITGVQGYDPTTGAYSTSMVTAGKYLIVWGSFSASGNTVTWGGTALTPDYQSATQINVPLSSSLSGTNSLVVKNSGGVASNSWSLTIAQAPLAPIITGITPSQGVQGQSVTLTIRGSGFLQVSNMSGNALPVSLNGMQLLTSRVDSDSQITATYSISTSATPGTVQIGVGGSNTMPFSIVAAVATPTITGVQGYPGYTDNQAVVGQYLVVYGSNFSGSGDSVYVNSIALTPTYDSATQINVYLDPSKANGAAGFIIPVYVKNAAGVQSNIKYINVAAASQSMAPSDMQMANMLESIKKALENLQQLVGQ